MTTASTIHPDLIIRNGTKGQIIEGDVGIDIRLAEELWFEYVPITYTSDSQAVRLIATVNPTINTRMQYTTNGTEFSVGYYYMIAVVKVSDTQIYYSDNKRTLQVKTKFE